MPQSPNSAQAEFWSDGGGVSWVKHETQLDALFGNVNAALIQQAAPQAGQKILDIGCGTGATARDFAKTVGPNGQVDGLDISTSLLAQARKTAAVQDLQNVKFTNADAQIHPLPTAIYDHVISRFGVMFFSNPTAAFKNIRSCLKQSGRLTMACWAPFKENPWFTIPRQIATTLLGSPPPFNPKDPGPFAFADTDYTLDILSRSGFSNPRVEPHNISLVLPGNAANAAQLAAYIGPANSVIRAQGGTETDKQTIITKTEEKLKLYEHDGAVKVPGKIYIYSADQTH